MNVLYALMLVGLPMLIGHRLGQTRNRVGWAWGLLLSWLGVLILACMRPVPAEQR